MRTLRNPSSVALALLAASLLPAGCVSMARRAPVVEQVVEFNPDAADAATLERGRTIYTTSCTDCHHVQPIEKWGLKKWREEILPEMTQQAELSQAQRADVEAYIIAAHEALERIPK
jgi:mono/diheme cytochrome c family protein